MKRPDPSGTVYKQSAGRSTLKVVPDNGVIVGGVTSTPAPITLPNELSAQVIGPGTISSTTIAS